ncbi:hypothetical protein SAMN05192583_0231 [Sphingomonas gellani]|uniref:Uncharacterized protein n=1 Tax=Sphingomonas gellani TaxID=1166340 RepID=A0A1H7YEF4_9SPHN|nr:hypothetical protein [Sphingomonas gellani]SEM44345.1 hypothetical protein SAMN05192583_0231 [Sphingomonas gellani]
MSNWGVLVPVAAITVGPVVWAFNNWTRARHGYVPERFEGEFEKRDAEERRRMDLLASDNERLAGQVTRLEERLRVLERIATDPATRTAQAIEALRD